MNAKKRNKWKERESKRGRDRDREANGQRYRERERDKGIELQRERETETYIEIERSWNEKIVQDIKNWLLSCITIFGSEKGVRFWLKYKGKGRKITFAMVPMSDGNSEIGAHVQSEFKAFC